MTVTLFVWAQSATTGIHSFNISVAADHERYTSHCLQHQSPAVIAPLRSRKRSGSFIEAVKKNDSGTRIGNNVPLDIRRDLSAERGLE